MTEEFDLQAVVEEMTADLERSRQHAADFIGLDEAAAVALAEDLGLELRLIRADRQPLTMDGRPRRVTVDLRTGVVTSANAG